MLFLGLYAVALARRLRRLTQPVRQRPVIAEVEAMCGRLAARRITQPEQHALAAAHQACEDAREANDPDNYYRLNERFHHLIYAASHNGFLAEQAVALHRRLKPYRRLQLRVRDRMSTSFAEHAGIVEAILAQDGELAAERLRAHVVVQGATLRGSGGLPAHAGRFGSWPGRASGEGLIFPGSQSD